MYFPTKKEVIFLGKKDKPSGSEGGLVLGLFMLLFFLTISPSWATEGTLNFCSEILEWSGLMDRIGSPKTSLLWAQLCGAHKSMGYYVFKVDKDGTGMIDFPEFLSMMSLKVTLIRLIIYATACKNTQRVKIFSKNRRMQRMRSARHSKCLTG